MKNFFSQNLKYLRKRKNLTQADFSVTMEKVHTTIGNWEKKVSEPNIDEIIRIVDFFNVSIDDIILKDLPNCDGIASLKKVEKREEPSAYDQPLLKLVESQQMNIETLQKLLDFKEDELNRLKMEIDFLKTKATGRAGHL